MRPTADETTSQERRPSDRGPRQDHRSQETLAQARNVTADLVPPPSRETKQNPGVIPAFFRRSSRKPHERSSTSGWAQRSSRTKRINGTGDGHRDVELSQMVDSRATVSFRSLAIWRPRITDRSDGPPAGAVRYPGVCTRSYAFPRYHKAASRRHPQQYVSVVTSALDAVGASAKPSPRERREGTHDPTTVCSRRRPLFRLTPQALPRSRQSCRNCPSHRRRVLSRAPNSRYSAWPRLIASSPSADRNP
jgi:hypothetical protein